jgi:hypothetical protein
VVGVGGVVAVVAVVVALAVARGGGGAGGGDRATPMPTDPDRAGVCADLDAGAVDAAMGGPADVAVADRDRCTISRPGTLLVVEVEQADDDATRADLTAVERLRGPDVDSMEPWPEEPVDGVGDAAVWLTDPAAGGGVGELWAIAGRRLVRVAVSAPPDYRRDPADIATQVAVVVLTGL